MLGYGQSMTTSIKLQFWKWQFWIETWFLIPTRPHLTGMGHILPELLSMIQPMSWNSKNTAQKCLVYFDPCSPNHGKVIMQQNSFLFLLVYCWFSYTCTLFFCTLLSYILPSGTVTFVIFFSLKVENVGECCKVHWVCIDQRIALHKSCLSLSLTFGMQYLLYDMFGVLLGQTLLLFV